MAVFYFRLIACQAINEKYDTDPTRRSPAYQAQQQEVARSAEILVLKTKRVSMREQRLASFVSDPPSTA